MNEVIPCNLYIQSGMSGVHVQPCPLFFSHHFHLCFGEGKASVSGVCRLRASISGSSCLASLLGKSQ